MEKINLVEILKDCPKGMELDCSIFEGIEFDSIVDNDYFPIRCRIKYSNDEYNVYNFTKHGCWDNDYKAKCVIFPKGKTTWEGFHRPFKDGDIVSTKNGLFIGIVKVKNNIQVNTYCAIGISGSFSMNIAYVFERFATEEEKQKLFDAIKANGYKWNAETKTLEKLIEPLFKVGDIIKDKCNLKWKVIDLNRHYYAVSLVLTGTSKLLEIKAQDDYELVPKKFDVSKLKPFDKVLVRDNDEQMWTADMFSFYNEKHVYPFMCVGHYTNQCIPYDQNKHLLGTTNKCDDYYKNWE